MSKAEEVWSYLIEIEAPKWKHQAIRDYLQDVVNSEDAPYRYAHVFWFPSGVRRYRLTAARSPSSGWGSRCCQT